MLSKQIIAVVIVYIPPHGVNMVAIVLSIIKLENKIAPLQTIVMLRMPLDSTHPCEAQLLEIDFR